VDARPSGSALAHAEARLAEEFARRGIDYPPRQVTLVVLKDEARLEVWVDDAGRRVFVRSYLVRSSSGRLGPKLAEGDHQVPEGVYRIAAFNPNSRYHLAMRLDYPNAFDQARAAADGRTRLGGDIMIHGGAVSDGCLPVGDAAVEELFALAARVGTAHVAVVIAPVDFRRDDFRTAAAGTTGGVPWLSDLYATIAGAMSAFPHQRYDRSVETGRRIAVAPPACRPYDVADCIRRCRTGDVGSCTRAGLMYADGRRVPADTAKAWAFLRDACARGDALGCAGLGRLYASDDGLERDVGRAAELARAACDAGDGHGCSDLARLCTAGLVYPGPHVACSTEVGQRLRERAVVLLQKNCKGWGAYDCDTLATIYGDGDRGTALRFAAGSCEAGDPGGCHDLGRLYEDGGEPMQAHALYERACRAGYAPACERAGTDGSRVVTAPG
jgi:TPR repeat protein